MEKYHYRIKSDCSSTVHFTYNKYLDNAWFAYHGYVLGEAEYEI